MTRKIKWIVLSVVLSVMGSVLAVSVLAGPATGPFQLQEDGSVAAAVGTGFTYQGKLENGSGPVTADCDHQVRAFTEIGLIHSGYRKIELHTPGREHLDAGFRQMLGDCPHRVGDARIFVAT